MNTYKIPKLQETEDNYINLFLLEQEAETTDEYFRACREVDDYVETHRIDWRVVNAKLSRRV